MRQHCLDLNNKYIIADEKFVTSINKLNKTKKDIYAGFSKTTKYDIAKGEKLLFNFNVVDISNHKEREKFVYEVKKFYSLRKLKIHLILEIFSLSNLFLFKINQKNNWLTYALFIHDKNRFRLLYFN